MKRATTLIVCAALGLASALQAFWTYVGPEGGPIAYGAITRGAAKTIHIASGGQRTPLIRSTDNGGSWSRTAGILVSPPQGMIAHATDPDLLYYMNGRSNYGTTDGGNSWFPLAVPGSFNLCALVAQPDDWNELFGGGFDEPGGNRRAAICHSLDAGQTWDIQTLGTIWGSTISALGIWSGNPDVIYAGGSDVGGMLYKSTDRGVSWDVVSNAAPVAYALDVDPADVDLLLAGTLGGVFRSSNGGVSWSQVLSGETRVLSRSAALPSLVYAPSGGSAYRSLDNGLTWTEISGGLPGAVSLCLLADPDDDNVVYCGTSVGMYKSTDRGSHWFTVNDGLLQYAEFNVLATAPEDPVATYAGARQCSPILRTTDRGGNWTPSGWFRGCGMVAGVAASRQVPGRVWVFEGQG